VVRAQLALYVGFPHLDISRISCRYELELFAVGKVYEKRVDRFRMVAPFHVHANPRMLDVDESPFDVDDHGRRD